MTAAPLPTVSVVMPAYNYGQFVGEALESVLDQTYPRELIDVIVIDDGSTDDTAAVVGRYVDLVPDTVRLVRQPNRGYVGTVNVGIERARGDLLALLDADDVWTGDKLAKQVRRLIDEPELGLVFSDLVLVDGAGVPYGRPTMLADMAENYPVPRARAAARLLFNNAVFESSIVMRRELASPIPEDLPIADWWIAVSAALHGEIDWVREPLVRYRVHGDNMSAGHHEGTGHAPRAGIYTTDLRWKLNAFRHLDMGVFTARELAYIWGGVVNNALHALKAAKTPYVDLTDGVTLDRERAAHSLTAADTAGVCADHEAEARHLFDALTWNPYLDGAAERLGRAAAAAL